MLENIHWLRHGSFKLAGAGKTVYIDPWELTAFEPADLILITHEHYDHCSPADLARLRGPQTVVVAPGDCAAKVGGQVQVVKPGEKLTVQGIEIETVPAYNLDKEFHPRKLDWVGYIVTYGGERIYHAGDTDFIPLMNGLKVDVALLPIGGTYTMDAEQGAAAANAIKPRVAVVPMHWGGIVGSRQDVERFVGLCQVPVLVLVPEQ